MTTKGKVLVLVSSGRGLPLKDGKVYAGAGYYLNELTEMCIRDSFRVGQTDVSENVAAALLDLDFFAHSWYSF